MCGHISVAAVLLAATTAMAQSELSPKGTLTPSQPPVGGVVDANGTLSTKASESLPDVKELIEAYVEATGGPAAWAELGGLESSWVWSLDTESGTLNIKANVSGAFRSEMAMNGSEWQESQGCDGKQAWIEDAAGVCHIASEAVRTQLQMQYDPTAVTHLMSYAKAVTTSGEVMIAGRPTWRVILVPKVGSSMYFFFDQETNLLVRWEFSRPTGGSPVLVERGFNDYQPVGSLMIPHTIRERSRAGTVEFKLESVSSKEIPASMLAMDECAKEAFARAAPATRSADQDSDRSGGPMHENLVKLIGPDLMTASGQPIDSRVLNDVPNVLLYFSAKWCGPCRRFTPQLVNYYEETGADRDFAVVLVSSDRSADNMLEYMKGSKMNWYTVPYDRIQPSGIKQAWGGRGIPNLVWLGPADQVIERSYVNGRYVGPNHVLNAFKDRNGDPAEASASGS